MYSKLPPDKPTNAHIPHTLTAYFLKDNYELFSLKKKTLALHEQ